MTVAGTTVLPREPFRPSSTQVSPPEVEEEYQPNPWKDATPEEWDDWRWQLKNRITRAEQLKLILNLSDEEIAFYDALAENESARQVMGEPTLRVIAHELVASIKGSVSVDWMHRETARARMRVLVKRLLRKYGYPPDLQDAAVQNVLQQAEVLSAQWAA